MFRARVSPPRSVVLSQVGRGIRLDRAVGLPPPGGAGGGRRSNSGHQHTHTKKRVCERERARMQDRPTARIRPWRLFEWTPTSGSKAAYLAVYGMCMQDD